MKRGNTVNIGFPALYRLGSKAAKEDPYLQFDTWFRQAKRMDLPGYDAMNVATCGKDGKPQGRMVLLKAYDQNGFIFYTNYESGKGRAIRENPDVALTFYWPALDYQIRIQGKATMVSAEMSDLYFASRSPESRAGAVVSPQSRPIPGRGSLEKEWKKLLKASGPEGVSRPDHWGGYRVKPYLFEFWLHGEHRLHDRIRYRLIKGKWIMDRLAP